VSASAQRPEDADRPVVRHTVRECPPVNQYAVIDTGIDMPSQHAMLVGHVIGKSRGRFVDRTRDFTTEPASTLISRFSNAGKHR